MRIFLNNEYDNLLHVVSILNNQSENLTVKEIASKVGLSITVVRGIVKSLEESELTTDSNLILEKRNEKLYSLRALNYPISELAEVLLKKSILYLMVKELFIRGKINTKLFCSEYSISSSSFSRNRTKLNMFFKRVDLELSRANTLIGNETIIRNFFITFFSNAHSTWIFHKDSYEEINQLLATIFVGWDRLTDNEKLRHCLILYVSRKRIASNNYFDDKFFIDVYKKLETRILITGLRNFYLNKGLSNEKMEMEISYIIFFLRKEELITNRTILLEIDEVLLKRTQYYKFNERIFYEMLSDIGLTEIHDNPKLKYSVISKFALMNTVISKSYIPYKYFYYIYDEKVFYGFDSTEKKLFGEVREFVSEVLLKSDLGKYYEQFLSLYSIEDLSYFYFIVLYAVLLEDTPVNIRPVSIFVEHSKYLNEIILLEKLAVFFGNTVKFVNFFSPEVDIVITDLPVTMHKGSKLSLSSYSDERDFENLLTNIVELRKNIFNGRIDYWFNMKW